VTTAEPSVTEVVSRRNMTRTTKCSTATLAATAVRVTTAARMP